MKAYSMDLRAKIVGAVEGGLSESEAGRVFGVALSTVKRYARQRAVVGRLAPGAHPGQARLIPAACHDALRAQWAAHNDATLEGHCRLWEGATGRRVSVATMWRMQRRLGWTRKKRRCGRPSATRRPAPPSAP